MLHLRRRREDIADILPKDSVGAEIGVFRGDFSKPLAKRTRPSRLYLIDPWWTVHGEWFSFCPTLSTRAAFDAAVAKMQWWIDNGRAVTVMERSQNALSAMPDRHLDWAYLDSSHDYTETKEELRLLSIKVKERGIICGHDFNTRRHPGVFRAIVEFLEEHRSLYELFYLDNFSQWAVRRRLLNVRGSKKEDSRKSADRLIDVDVPLQSGRRARRVSLCTTCMGRLSDLKRTLPLNMESHTGYEHVEFVILDYNSNDGLGDWIRANFKEHLRSGRLIYVRTEEPRFYSMAHSRNVAFKAATGDIVCNVDADNYTFDVSSLPEERSGICFAEYLDRLAGTESESMVFAKDAKTMRGRLGFFRKDFIGRLGGYDEEFKGYGYDDHDLFNRAVKLGFTFKKFCGGYYSRIHTPKGMRGVNMEDKRWRLSEADNRALSNANIASGLLLANRGRGWGKARLKKNFAEWIEV